MTAGTESILPSSALSSNDNSWGAAPMGLHQATFRLAFALAPVAGLGAQMGRPLQILHRICDSLDVPVQYDCATRRISFRLDPTAPPVAGSHGPSDPQELRPTVVALLRAAQEGTPQSAMSSWRALEQGLAAAAIPELRYRVTHSDNVTCQRRLGDIALGDSFEMIAAGAYIKLKLLGPGRSAQLLVMPPENVGLRSPSYFLTPIPTPAAMRVMLDDWTAVPEAHVGWVALSKKESNVTYRVGIDETCRDIYVSFMAPDSVISTKLVLAPIAPASATHYMSYVVRVERHRDYCEAWRAELTDVLLGKPELRGLAKIPSDARIIDQRNLSRAGGVGELRAMLGDELAGFFEAVAPK